MRGQPSPLEWAKLCQQYQRICREIDKLFSVRSADLESVQGLNQVQSKLTMGKLVELQKLKREEEELFRQLFPPVSEA